MEKTCVVCHDRPASYRCVQCHKPVCDTCGFKDAQGAFCSRECSADYRAFQETETEEGGGGLGSLLVKVIILIVLAVVAVAAYLYLTGGEEKLRETVGDVERRLEEGKEEVEERLGE